LGRPHARVKRSQPLGGTLSFLEDHARVVCAPTADVGIRSIRSPIEIAFKITDHTRRRVCAMRCA
jgi:hypothetical protein